MSSMNKGIVLHKSLNKLHDSHVTENILIGKGL